MQDCKVQAHYTKTSCIFVYSNEQSENDNTKTGPITNSFQTNKPIKYLGINLTKEIQDKQQNKLNKRSTCTLKTTVLKEMKNLNTQKDTLWS